MKQNKSSLKSFSNLIIALGGVSTIPHTYKYLHELLEKQKSWGNKTAALFVKAVYNTHVGFAKDLHFWEDAPTSFQNGDELFLPVDAVILFIFEKLGKPCSLSFGGINNYLKQNFPKSDFVIWDDLWFWGFITQKGGGKLRTMEFNEAKYWNLLHSPKDAKSLAEITILSKQFLELLTGK